MPLDDAIAEIDRIQAGLPGAKRGALHSIGRDLLARERQHFGQLSKTGSSEGVSWPRMAESTLKKRLALQKRGLLANADPEQIGVLTGHLSKSFRYVTDNTTEVRLINTDKEASAFAARRPIFPPTVPPAWLSSSETIAQKSLDQLSNPGNPQ